MARNKVLNHYGLVLVVTIIKQAHITTIITNKISNETYYFHIVHIVNACFFNVGTKH